MCSPTPPQQSFTDAANLQADAATKLATQNTYANRPTQNTPWGSTYWTQGQQTDPATGQPVTSWTQNQQLDPALQGALNNQLGIQQGRSDLAGGFMGRVADEYQTPFNWSNLPQMAGTPQQQFTYGRNAQGYIPQTTQAMNQPAFSAERQQLEQAQLQRLAPQQQLEREQLQTQLANQGITRGNNEFRGDAYSRATSDQADQFSRDQYNALMNAGNEQARMQQMMLAQQGQAFQQGAAQGQFYNTAQQQMFGQDQAANAQNYQQMMQGSQYQNQLRQQAIAEQQLGRSMSLNEMNALLSGQQVGTPQMPGFMSATSGQAPQLLQAQLGGAQIGAAQNAGLWGGLGSLAGSGLGLYALGGGNFGNLFSSGGGAAVPV